MPGPIPKRSEERRRRNKDGIEVLVVDLDNALAQEVEVPAPPMKTEAWDEELQDYVALEEPESEWHPTAEAWYRSLARSGQAIFYEPSDWSTAYVLAGQLSLAMEPRPVQIGMDSEGKPIFRTMVVPMPGSALTAWLKGAAALMTTEGERRRLRIELERKKRADEIAGGDGTVVDILKNRQDIFAGASRG